MFSEFVSCSKGEEWFSSINNSIHTYIHKMTNIRTICISSCDIKLRKAIIFYSISAITTDIYGIFWECCLKILFYFFRWIKSREIFESCSWLFLLFIIIFDLKFPYYRSIDIIIKDKSIVNEVNQSFLCFFLLNSVFGFDSQLDSDYLILFVS